MSSFLTAEILGMASEERRPSTVLTTNPFIEITDTSLNIKSEEKRAERTPSPTLDDMLAWKPYSPKTTRHRMNADTQYADTEVEELMNMLRETESLEEQGDILQYLVRFKEK